MLKIYLAFFFLTTAFFTQNSVAQVAKDTTPVSVNVELEQLMNSKTPRELIIKGITVSGTKSMDPNLIISISGLAVGDKITIPGTDAFSKAITNLWKQNLISDVEIFFTKL